jgi:hypothetical protein
MKKFAFFLTMVIFVACAKAPEYENFKVSEEVESIAQDVSADRAIPLTTTERKIVRSGEISIEVRDLKKAKTTLDTLVARHGAYYNYESYNEPDNESISYNQKVRIPAASFDAFVAAVESGIGETIRKYIDTDDVTEEFFDLETRLANKRAYLARYRELLAKASTIKDVLEIENSIRTLEEELESAEGRLRLLANKTEYSTLSVHLWQDVPVGDTHNFWHKAAVALTSGWRGFVAFIIVVLNLWPLFLIAGITLIVVRIVKKK